MREELESVLDDFRPGFEADGVEVLIDQVDPTGVIFLRLLVGPNACEECLLPDDALSMMLLAAMQPVMPNLKEIKVRREKGPARQ